MKQTNKIAVFILRKICTNECKEKRNNSDAIIKQQKLMAANGSANLMKTDKRPSRIGFFFVLLFRLDSSSHSACSLLSSLHPLCAFVSSYSWTRITTAAIRSLALHYIFFQMQNYPLTSRKDFLRLWIWLKFGPYNSNLMIQFASRPVDFSVAIIPSQISRSFMLNAI